MRDAEKIGFVSHRSDELQPDGQTVRSRPTRDRNRRQTAEICRAIVAQEQCARWMICAADRSRFLADSRYGNRRGGYSERIELRIGHRRVETSDESLALLQCLQIGCGRNLRAEFQPRANIFAVIRSVSRKPSGILMVMRRFRPCDLVAG